MMEKIIIPDMAEELGRLGAEYHAATQRAAAALRTDLPGRELNANALKRFLPEDEKAADIVRRIRKNQSGK